jgi:M6 family metalloprotease-like protein
LCALLVCQIVSAQTLRDFGFDNMSAATSRLQGRPLLVILVEFSFASPLPFTNAQADSLIFGSSGKTLNRYYLDASNERFRWSRARVIGPFRINSDAATQRALYLMDNEVGISRVMRMVLEAEARSNGFDIGKFDLDSDGKISAEELGILVIHNGVGEGGRGIDPSGCLQPAGASAAICGDAHRVSTVVPDLNTMGHELTHQLGAIDLYGRNDAMHPGLTVMGASYSLNLDPWHKLQFGWVAPRIRPMSSPGSDVLWATQMLKSDAPVILFDPGRGPDEFFILEYRTRTSSKGAGSDGEIPAQGMAVWHVQHGPNHKPNVISGVFTVVQLGAPFLAEGSNLLWGSGTMTPPLRWFDGTSTKIRLFVNPFNDGSDSIRVTWGDQVSAIYRQVPWKISRLGGEVPDPFAAFSQVPGALTQISVGAPDSIWGINNAEEVFEFNKKSHGFELFEPLVSKLEPAPRPYRLVQLSVKAGSVWGIDAAHQISFFEGTAHVVLAPLAQIPGIPVQILALGPTEAWAINDGFQIFRFNQSRGVFDQIPGTLRQLVGYSESNLWGINQSNEVFRFKPSPNGAPGGFEPVTDGGNPAPQLIQIAADNQGNAWGISPLHEIYAYSATAKRFLRIPGALVQLSASPAGVVFGINGRNETYRLDPAAQGFARVPTSLRQVTSGDSGSVIFGLATSGGSWGLK